MSSFADKSGGALIGEGRQQDGGGKQMVAAAAAKAHSAAARGRCNAEKTRGRWGRSEVCKQNFSIVGRTKNAVSHTLSRAITAGVASTYNASVRRLQLAAINSTAFSMIPPVPDRAARRAVLARHSKVHNLLSQLSSQPLDTMLAACITRDDYCVSPYGAPDSRPASQRPWGADDTGGDEVF